MFAFSFRLIAFCTVAIVFAPNISAYDGQPETAEDFLDRARDHFSRRRFLNALDSLRVTLQMTENENARIHAPKREAEILAAECLKELGRSEEAANMYERADTHGLNDKRVLSYLALHFERRKDYERAMPYFERYYALDKTDVSAHIRYAAASGLLGNRKRAREILEGIEAQPAPKKTEECEVMEQQKKYRASAECYLSALKGRPDSVKNFLAVYRVAAHLKASPLRSEYATYLYYIFGDEARYVWPLVEIYLADKKFYRARKLLEEIVALNTGDTDAERLLTNLKATAPQALERPFGANKKEVHLLDP